MIDDEDNAFFSLFDNTATEKSHQTSEPIMLIPHLTAVRWHRSETSGTRLRFGLSFTPRGRARI